MVPTADILFGDLLAGSSTLDDIHNLSDQCGDAPALLGDDEYLRPADGAEYLDDAEPVQGYYLP